MKGFNWGGYLLSFCLCLSGFFITKLAYAQGNISCGTATDYDIVIMLDKTSSVSSSDMQKQKNAAKDLLDLLKTFTSPPPVAIGKFQCPNGVNDGGDCSWQEGATIVGSGEFTTNYGNANPATGLYAAINGISNSTAGWTGYSWAITRARKLVEGKSLKSRHALFLIGDAMTNRPRKDKNSDYDCPTSYSMGKASDAADLAEAGNFDIFTIYFNSSPNSGCNGFPQKGKDFFMNDIASSPNHAYDGNSDLSGILKVIANNSSCDDGNACTINTCDTTTNMCVSTPATSGDDDGDGVDNCVDQCQGFDDAELGKTCSEGTGVCQASGKIVCSTAGLVCDAEIGDPQTEVCNGIDDNCNGFVDENLDLGTCQAGSGACQSTGNEVCINGVIECSATPTDPGTEICNGVDDDCDGQVDEDLGNLGSCIGGGVGSCATEGILSCVDGKESCNAQPGEPSAEICDGIDNDCDGAVDEELGNMGSCTVGKGACTNSSGTLQCVDGSSECVGDPLEASTESCNGIDDDCDGSTDEENVCGCESTSLSALALELDNNATSMYKYSKMLSKIAAAELAKGNLNISKAALKTLTKKFLAATNAVFMDLWHLAYLSLPQQEISCESEISCLSVSIAGPINEGLEKSKQMVALVKQYYKKSGLAKIKVGKSTVTKVVKTDQENKATFALYPTDVLQCP